MMRRLLQRQRIRSRLILLSTAVACSALLLACFVFWAYESIVYLQALRRESLTITRMLAESSAAAMTFHDRAAASGLANTLRAEPRVSKACFFDAEGTALATYPRTQESNDCPTPVSTGAEHFTVKHLLISYPVVLDAETVGSLYLEVDLGGMYRMWFRYGLISAIVLCMATLFAMALSSRLQRMISDPILHLARVAGEVSGSGQYSLRAVKTFEDETGQLIDQFNEMMEKVNERDQQLKRAQDELEMRVEERTQSLRNEIAERKAVEQSLVNAKLAAESANRAKSGFLANMSHELRTPLNAILGYSEMLEEDAHAAGDASAETDLQRIQFAGRHLLELVNDVLDISKIEAGALQLHLETVHSNDIIRDVAATIEPLARKNGNHFEIEPGTGGFVHVDVMKFRQSLLNLLSNACKFTEKGTVSLSVDPVEEDRQYVCWRVRDTGIGIAAEDINRLFQPFTQVDSSATRRHGGTGLGLAISHRLCALMGGKITVESSPGAGSTFTVWMPRSGVALGERGEAE